MGSVTELACAQTKPLLTDPMGRHGIDTCSNILDVGCTLPTIGFGIWWTRFKCS